MELSYLLAGYLVLAAVATPGIAASNEAPLADAGLDQNVTRGTTVYLDGGGSRDPGGTVERYRWNVAAESGDVPSTTTTQCRDCQQTRFQAEATGTYRVTLDVTDDDGTTATPHDSPPTPALAAHRSTDSSGASTAKRCHRWNDAQARCSSSNTNWKSLLAAVELALDSALFGYLEDVPHVEVDVLGVDVLVFVVDVADAMDDSSDAFGFLGVFLAEVVRDVAEYVAFLGVVVV